MKRLLLFIPLVIFVCLSILFYNLLQREGYDPQALPSALIGKSVPEFSLTDLNGYPVTDKDLKGQVYLLNVWATWCATCRVEHPYLNALAKEGVRIIGLDYKDDTAKAINWLKQLGNPYAQVIVDEVGKLGLDLGVSGAPETYLVDKQGIIRYKHIGVVDQKLWQNTLKAEYEKWQK